MCVIISCREKLPEPKILKLAERANRDGGGVAWIHEGAVRWKKGITAAEMNKLVADGEIKAPAVFHFRLATVGRPSAALCHPFPIQLGSPTDLEGTTHGEVFFHNGHWSSWRQVYDRTPLEGEASDSRVLAAWLAQLSLQLVDKALESLSVSNKFVRFSPSGATLYGRWFMVAGMACSNTYFLPLHA